MGRNLLKVWRVANVTNTKPEALATAEDAVGAARHNEAPEQHPDERRWKIVGC